MAKLFLHIGMAKTGSTSIQETLAKYDLPDHHFFTFDGGRSPDIVAANHNPFVLYLFAREEFRERLSGLRTHFPENLRELMLEDLQHQLRTVKKPNFVFSAENLSTVGLASAAADMKAFFEPYVDQIQVIGYVRSPYSFFSSRYQEFLKYGALGQAKQLPTRFVGYQGRFEAFDAVYGRENVSLKKFAPEKLKNGDVVADFFDQIGAEMPIRAGSRDNIGLSLQAMSALQLSHEVGPGFDFQSSESILDRQVVLDWLSSFGSGKGQLNPSFFSGNHRRFAEDVAWMEGRLGTSLMDNDTEREESPNSREELRNIVLNHVAELRALLISQIDEQDDPELKVVELLDLLHQLARSRRIHDEPREP